MIHLSPKSIKAVFLLVRNLSHDAGLGLFMQFPFYKTILDMRPPLQLLLSLLLFYLFIFLIFNFLLFSLQKRFVPLLKSISVLRSHRLVVWCGVLGCVVLLLQIFYVEHVIFPLLVLLDFLQLLLVLFSLLLCILLFTCLFFTLLDSLQLF